MEWVFRSVAILISLLQWMIRNSETGRYCIEEVKLLEEEGMWLKTLILVQLIKIIILSVWHIILNRRKNGFFADDQGSDDEYEE